MLLFVIGLLIGGFVGMLTMCLFAVSSRSSRWDDDYETDAQSSAPEAFEEQQTKK